MYPPIETEIRSVSRYTDDNGEGWIVINQDTHYPLSVWSEDEAIADYQDLRRAEERADAEWRMWTD
jgi:hypothetical protein